MGVNVDVVLGMSMSVSVDMSVGMSVCGKVI